MWLTLLLGTVAAGLEQPVCMQGASVTMTPHKLQIIQRQVVPEGVPRVTAPHHVCVCVGGGPPLALPEGVYCTVELSMCVCVGSGPPFALPEGVYCTVELSVGVGVGGGPPFALPEGVYCSVELSVCVCWRWASFRCAGGGLLHAELNMRVCWRCASFRSAGGGLLHC